MTCLIRNSEPHSNLEKLALNSRQKYTNLIRKWGTHFYFVPVNGNAGDALINFSFLKALEETNINYTFCNDIKEIEDGSNVIYPAAGGLHPKLTGAKQIIEELCNKRCNVIIGPATLSGYNLNPTDGLVFIDRSNSAVTEPNTYTLVDAAIWLCASGKKITFPKVNIFRPKIILLILRHQAISTLISVYSRLAGVTFYRNDVESNKRNKMTRNIDLSLVFGSMVTDRDGACISAYYFLKCISAARQNILTDRLHIVLGAIITGRNIEYTDTIDGKIASCLAAIDRELSASDSNLSVEF